MTCPLASSAFAAAAWTTGAIAEAKGAPKWSKYGHTGTGACCFVPLSHKICVRAGAQVIAPLSEIAQLVASTGSIVYATAWTLVPSCLDHKRVQISQSNLTRTSIPYHLSCCEELPGQSQQYNRCPLERRGPLNLADYQIARVSLHDQNRLRHKFAGW